ncbi:MAG: dehydrogenase [Oscillospiraceae bacterium]|nr:dehydrogenase [Oscillospiraceae bacterium]
MSKEQFYDPKALRKPGKIKFKNIDVCQYQKTAKDVLADGSFTAAELVEIYRDMKYIREFEEMLRSVRNEKVYNGVEYAYTGPAHLYIGEESAAVGQSYLLGKDDFLFGTHRSHGEVLAKGLSAIAKMSDKELLEVMETTFEGKPYAVVKEHLPQASVKEQATEFFLYGLMCELFGRENGFAKGLGNSMHLFFLPFGIYPNNAIVGGSPCIAAGAALYKKNMKKPGIVVANGGDGSLGCGPVWEALNFAGMDQFKTLWPDEYKGGLPVIFNFMNNGYGMGGRTNGETMSYGELARVGAGMNPDQMHTERVDGLNPLAVIDAYRRKMKLIHENKGPVLLDVLTYRLTGHSTSDQNAYRSKEELDAWEANDCIALFRKQLIDAGIATDADVDQINADIKARITSVLKVAIDLSISPRIDFLKDPDAISRYTFNNGHQTAMADGKPYVLTEKAENTRVKKIANKVRAAVQDGKPVSKLKQFTLRDGIFEAIMDKYYEDPTLVSYGEDVREWGGAFGVYQGLSDSIPFNRLFNSPISESCIVASAVGYGMCGGRSITELMYCDFMGRAGDEIFNQMAKWQAMSAGQLKLPMVLRVSVGRKYGAQHSQDWTALPAHVPGLKVVFPVTPYDAKGMMAAALNGTDPVIFMESQLLYDKGEEFHLEGVPTESYEIPFGEPDIKRAGKDITILTVGPTLYKALKAADILKEQFGLEAEVIDARSVVPFNYDKVLASVKKTGKIILASDACTRGSIVNDMATHINALAFDDLDAPAVVIGAKNWITPCPEMEEHFFPNEHWFIDAIHEKIMPLPGYTPKTNFTREEELRLERTGM